MQLTRFRGLFILLMMGSLLLGIAVTAQEADLAATLEVMSGEVEVLRTGTTNWIAVEVEAIVGVGDTIRTGEEGQVRITFFADGVDTVVLPNSEYAIHEFSGSPDSFRLTVEVLIGNTLQQIRRTLDVSSTYSVLTPGMTLSARGTEFAIRVEEDTLRSAMIVGEGMVDATDAGDADEVPQGFGVRSEVGVELSDVVKATTFPELDAALDGCISSFSTIDDLSVNVRLGPDTGYSRVGTVDAAEVERFTGTLENSNWYRIPFREHFGWILVSQSVIDPACAGLRIFPTDHVEEADNYAYLGDPVDTEDLVTSVPLAEEPQPEPEATEAVDE